MGKTYGEYMGRAYSPWVVHDGTKTLGVIQGWYQAAPLALGSGRANGPAPS